MAQEMDFSPRKVMHFAQFGLMDRLSEINTFWKCASCHACSVKCPRGIDIAKVMEALGQQTLRKSKNYIEPSQMSKEAIAEMPQIALSGTERWAVEYRESAWAWITCTQY